MAAQVLFIGLDSAETDLLDRWCDDGSLPVLRSLRARAACGPVRICPGFSNGAMWPSLFTGVNIGRHGRYFRYTPAGRFDVDRDFAEPPIWTLLSRQGRRVAVLDVPLAPLTPELNGIQLADWMTHDRVGAPRSWPASLVSEVVARFGDDPFGGYSDVRYPAIGPVRLRDEILERIGRKTDFALRALGQGDWDLFMVAFGDPHDVGHLCWHLHDPRHPQHDPEWARRFGDPLKAVYVAVDGAIGALVERAGPDATVMLFTGPGMGPRYSGNFLLAEVLRRLDAPRQTLGSRVVGGLRSVYRTLVPPAVRRRVLSPAVAPVAVRARTAERNWSRSFVTPHGESAGAIRVNLRGREPQGRVAPGSEFRAYCDALSKDLLDLVNLDTGRPAVKDVLRVADLCHGPCVERLPDLLVLWNREAWIAGVGSPKVGEIRGTGEALRTGDHTDSAYLVTLGAGIAPERLPPSVAVEDIAPTIAARLGVPTPGLDGSPIRELLG